MKGEARMAAGDPMIIAQVAQSLVNHLHERGVDPRPLLANWRLDLEGPDAFDARVPLRSYVRLFEQAAAATGDPALGLHLSAQVGPEVLGALGFLFLSSASLGEALGNLARYTAAIQDATEMKIVAADGLAQVSYQIRHDAIAPRAQDAEFSLACTYRLMRSYVGPRLRVAEAHFEHSPISPLKTYEAVFRCPVYFRQATNALVLDEADLRIASSGGNAKLFPILEGQIRELVAKKERLSSMADRVREALTPAALQLGAGAAKVAGDFGISESTLHRRLRAEGAAFQALLDERRLDLARHLLADRDISVSDVAVSVGFSENAAFTRAFHRWTGLSPRDYRAACASGAA